MSDTTDQQALNRLRCEVDGMVKCYAVGEIGESVFGVISKDTDMVDQTQRCKIPKCIRKRS